MAEVKVLVAGKHQIDGDKLIIGATVTLIKSNKNIIVDPGHLADQEQLLAELAKNSLKPEDIDLVFLTHSHIEHTSNLFLFKQALVYCKLRAGYPGQYHNLNQGYLVRTEIKDGLILDKDVEFLLTPGHSEDHVSLLVNSKEGKIVVAGDAIANKKQADLAEIPFLYTDLEDYNNSRQKILALADFIIPGHGEMFKVSK